MAAHETGSGGHTTAHFIRRSRHVTQQNLMQQMRRGQFLPVVQAVVDTPATITDYQNLAEIVQQALEQNLEPDRIEAQMRETTPFGLTQYLPRLEHSPSPNPSNRLAWHSLYVAPI